MFILELGLIGLCIALLPLSWVWVKADDNKFRKLVWLTTFMTLDLVMFGGFTRLTDSGLGCPDWPGCYASASPLGAQPQIQAAQAALPSGPVTPHKAWIEMIHRYLATAVGGLTALLAALSWFASRRWRLPVSPWWATATLAWI